MQIIDAFTITLKGHAGAYTIEADGPRGIRVEPQPFIWSPTHEQRATLAALASEEAHISPDAMLELGRALYSAAFTSHIATAYGQALGIVDAKKGLRLCLQIEPPELVSLPWEAIHNGKDWFVAQSETPLVRTLPQQPGYRTTEKLQVRGALKILFAGASPRDLRGLKIEETAQQLRQLLKEEIARRRVAFAILLNPTPDELRRRLLGDYHILYFAGHGNPNGIFLDDGQGDEEGEGKNRRRLPGYSHLVSAQELARMLEGKQTRLVFLAACNTNAALAGTNGVSVGFAQELITRAKLPAIAAMQYPISDMQAHQLTAQFFAALAAFRSVDVAMAEARKALLRREQVGRDVITPVMYLQARDGALFQRAKNWPAIGLATALFISILVLCVTLVLGSRALFLSAMDRQHAQSTAQAESTRGAIEANNRATAETQANASHREAIIRQLTTRAQTLLDNSNPVVGTLLAVESLRRLPSWEGNEVLTRGLSQLPQQAIEMVQGSRVSGVTFSKDGRWLATGGYDGVVRVWETATGREMVQMAHEDRVSGVAFSPDGKRLVTTSWDRTAQVWDVTTGRELARMEHAGLVSDMALSADGKWLVTSSWKNTVQVWETDTGRKIAQMIHDDEVAAMTFSPDGRRIATGDRNGTTRIWGTVSGKEITRMNLEDDVLSVAFSHDGKRLATGGYDKTARIWDVTTGQEIARMNHELSVLIVVFSPDDKWLATGSNDLTARVWEIATGRELARMLGNEDGVRAVAFSPDGRWLATASLNQGAPAPGPCTARLWEVTTGREVAQVQHKNWVSTLAFSPDGRWLATGSDDGTTKLWPIPPEQEAKLAATHEDVISAITFSRDGKWLATGSWDGTARMWEVTTGREISRFAHDDLVSAVAFNLDAKYLATGSQDRTARIWDVATGQEIARIAPGNLVFAVAFSPDGKWLAIGTRDQGVRMSEVATGKEVAHFAHEGDVNAVAFSPDGKRLATGSRDTVRVWDMSTNQEVARMTHEGEVMTLAFSSDGKWLASGSRDGIARVWSADGYQELTEWKHEKGVYTVAFSPDGKWLATGSGYLYFERGYVRIWEVSTGQEVVRTANDDGVRSLAFAPDGKRLATASRNSVQMRLWLQEDFIAEACSRLPRNLTKQEWTQYFPGEPYRSTCSNLPVSEK